MCTDGRSMGQCPRLLRDAVMGGARENVKGPEADSDAGADADIYPFSTVVLSVAATVGGACGYM